jgi:hypothetical protein
VPGLRVTWQRERGHGRERGRCEIEVRRQHGREGAGAAGVPCDVAASAGACDVATTAGADGLAGRGNGVSWQRQRGPVSWQRPTSTFASSTWGGNACGGVSTRGRGFAVAAAYLGPRFLPGSLSCFR